MENPKLPLHEDLHNVVQLIVGEQLSSVTFVQDYWQLDFGGHGFTVLTSISVTENGKSVRSGEDQFRNRLCEQIAKIVRSVEFTKDALTIIFVDDCAISVPVRQKDYKGPEALHFKSYKIKTLYVV